MITIEDTESTEKIRERKSSESKVKSLKLKRRPVAVE
jgi:hypothetical protein